VPTSVPISAGGDSNTAAGQDTAESELVGPLPDDDDDEYDDEYDAEYDDEYDDDYDARSEWAATPEQTPERLGPRPRARPLPPLPGQLELKFAARSRDHDADPGARSPMLVTLVQIRSLGSTVD
jgi:hypothetical protein